MDQDEHRRKRLIELVRDRFDGNEQSVGRALGYVDGSFVRQMMKEGPTGRLITEKTVRKIEGLYGLDGWFSRGQHKTIPNYLENSPNKKVTQPLILVPFLTFDQLTLMEALNTDPHLYTAPRVTAWETSGKRTKLVEVSDEAMFPLVQSGSRVQLDPDLLPTAGDKVLVVDGAGAYHLREYRVRASETFEATPINPAYPTLESKTHNLRVIAVATHVTQSIFAGDRR